MGGPAPDVDLCVVVVNYRTPAIVIDCLESLMPEIRRLGGMVAVVDNASPDDSVPRLSSWIRDEGAQDLVKLIESPENGGFAAGNNLGIRSCDAKLYLLLNSDTLVREGALEKLVAVMSSEQGVGLVSPRLEWPDGKPQESCFRYLNPVSELITGANTGLVTKLLSRYEVPIRVSDERSFPEWTSFACVMIRREVIEQIGGLDDGFFMYFEDAEFSFRARRAGWRILHEPAARVVHLRGGSSPMKSLKRLRKRLPRYFYESRTRYFYKLYGRLGLLAANSCWTIGRMISLLRSLMQRRTFRPKASEAQWRDIWVNFWNPLAAYTHPQQHKK
jgi:GT2 family glycosyltransferase